ncbi:uncharacterized protein [Nicotiana sylvestris]|uniref:uncharacterized protein n=1 Tax=Nicotiana sylvestris TaxID=4096 RepID=UPI00388C5CE9
MTHQVSTIVYSMAPKLEDPRAFTIPCTIGNAEFAKALCDLGASINLMPYSVFKTLGIGQPRSTSMRLQMANCTMKIPLGVIEDVGDEKVVFCMCKSMRQPNNKEVCSFVDLVTDVIVDETIDVMNVNDTLEDILLNFDDDDIDGFIECVNSLQGMGAYTYEPCKLSLDLENRTTSPTKPSIKDPPILELKPLPPHLRYEFLGHSSTLPIILV